MTKFSEFKKQSLCTEPIKKERVSEDDILDLIDRYSHMDKDQLMNEFVKASKVKREEGGFGDDEIEHLEKTLSPYLNENQKQMFGNLMEIGKNAE